MIARYRPKKRCPSLLEDKFYTKKVCDERRRRIRLSIAAYAYEIASRPIMSDAEYDRLALLVDTSIDTGRPELDDFFRREFDPYTGSWIHAHPGLAVIAKIYRTFWTKEVYNALWW